jgi:hypothetical protein
MAESTNIVRVSEVYKTFQLGKVEVEALQGVNLEIARGNYISIMLTLPSWTPMNWPGCAAVKLVIYFKHLISFRS